MNPKVSIIIPTYNRAKFLGKAIESAINQDYPNKEIIISDNASTDNTFDVVKQYLNHPEIKYYRNETNIGMVPNWRKALYEYAKGDYAIVLSDDDFFIDNSYITKAINLFKSNENIGLVHANFIIWHQNENYALRTCFNLPKIIDGKEYFFNSGNLYPFPHFLTVLFDRNLAISLEAFTENVPGSDGLLWLKLMLYSNVGFVIDLVAVYRMHSRNTITNMPVEEHMENLIVFRKPAEMAIRLGLDEQRVKTLLDNWENFYLVNSLSTAALFKIRNKYRIPFMKIVGKFLKQSIKHFLVSLIGYKNFYLLKRTIYKGSIDKKGDYCLLQKFDF
ncbi:MULTISPECIES: glycosyltransferase family 2 protein [Thermodesulfovibrio]|uniref:glycosyltransferase family 2 protein n=1 Tax=Thermodesulfovibrio yellowstonii TaxID=28262 RepID=UPI00040453DF|nr:glycosyltransferase [Thermodesulfovibrio islandicus]